MQSDYNTSWTAFVDTAFAEFKAWIRSGDHGGEYCGDGFGGKRWERDAGYPNGEKWVLMRLAGKAPRVDGDAMAVFFADREATDSGAVYFTANGTIYRHNKTPSAANWKYQTEGTAPVIKLTAAEIEAMKERDRREAERAAREAAEADRKKRERAAALLRADTLAYYRDSLTVDAAPADSTGLLYLRRKHVQPTAGVKIVANDRDTWPFIPRGALIIPLYDVADPAAGIIGFHWITNEDFTDPRDGHEVKNKIWRAGSILKDQPFAHWNGTPRGAELVALAEGYATAATWYQLTGIPTATTCDKEHLKITACRLLDAAPNVTIIIAADNDLSTAIKQGGENPGISAAADIRAYAKRRGDTSRVLVVPPPFDTGRGSGADKLHVSDWNDIFVSALNCDAAAARQIALEAIAKAYRKEHAKHDHE